MAERSNARTGPVVEKQGSAVLITGAASVRGQDPAVRADEETQRISTAHRHGRWMQPRADGHNALDGDSDRTPTSVAARSSRRCPGSSTTSRSGRHVGSRYPPTRRRCRRLIRRTATASPPVRYAALQSSRWCRRKGPAR